MSKIKPSDGNKPSNAGFKPSKKVMLRDDSGTPTKAGDTILFGFGKPPVVVRAKVVKRDHSLLIKIPVECNLRSLKKLVGAWFRMNK